MSDVISVSSLCLYLTCIWVHTWLALVIVVYVIFYGYCVSLATTARNIDKKRQMAVGWRPCNDFIIYTTKVISIKRIYFDLWENKLLPKLTSSTITVWPQRYYILCILLVFQYAICQNEHRPHDIVSFVQQYCILCVHCLCSFKVTIFIFQWWAIIFSFFVSRGGDKWWEKVGKPCTDTIWLVRRAMLIGKTPFRIVKFFIFCRTLYVNTQLRNSPCRTSSGVSCFRPAEKGGMLSLTSMSCSWSWIVNPRSAITEMFSFPSNLQSKPEQQVSSGSIIDPK